MCQWILKANGRVVPYRTCRPLTVEELNSPTEQSECQQFNAEIEGRLGSSITQPSRATMKKQRKLQNSPDIIEHDDFLQNDDFIFHEDEEESRAPVRDAKDDNPVDSQGKSINMQPHADQIIGSEIKLQHGDQMHVGKVKRRKIGEDGRTVGHCNPNPILNTLEHEVEFPDGTIKEFAVNVLAEKMISQVDSNGFSIFDGILDAKKDDTAVSKADRWIITKRGNRRLKQTTQGWKLLVQWKDGSKSWIPAEN